MINDDLIQVNEEIEDMSNYTFKYHNESVYCVAINDHIPGLIISGVRSYLLMKF